MSEADAVGSCGGSTGGCNSDDDDDEMIMVVMTMINIVMSLSTVAELYTV